MSLCPPPTIDPASGLITWDVPVVGIYSFVVKVSDNITNATESYTLDIRRSTAPTITPIDDQMAMAGTPYSYNVQATDDNNDSLQYYLDTDVTSVSMPPPTIDPASGLITWDVPVVGIYSFVVKVSDNITNATESYTLAILPTSNVAPIIRSISANDTYSSGDEFTISVDAFDDNAGDTLTYTIETSLSDAEITIDSTTGIITGSVDPTGTYTITITVTDDYGAFDMNTLAFDVSIPPPPTPPTPPPTPPPQIMTNAVCR